MLVACQSRTKLLATFAFRRRTGGWLLTIPRVFTFTFTYNSLHIILVSYPYLSHRCAAFATSNSSRQRWGPPLPWRRFATRSKTRQWIINAGKMLSLFCLHPITCLPKSMFIDRFSLTPSRPIKPKSCLKFGEFWCPPPQKKRTNPPTFYVAAATAAFCVANIRECNSDRNFTTSNLFSHKLSQTNEGLSSCRWRHTWR